MAHRFWCSANRLLGRSSLQEFFLQCLQLGAIQVSAEPGDRLKVVFDGDALSRAATARLDQCISNSNSQRHPRTVAAFATHQPNPRLVALLAKNLEALNGFLRSRRFAAILVQLPAQPPFTARSRHFA
jgi:hypothetical protein